MADTVIEMGDTHKSDEKQDKVDKNVSEEKKQMVGFVEPQNTELTLAPQNTEVKIGTIETVEDEKTKLQPKKNNRTTTLAKVRKTLADGAKETADVISDASSFSLANNVEAIVWAIQESKDDEWQIPDDLTLCEAFLLFWRSNDGSIEGRKTSASLQALAYGAMLADLVHLDKITAQKMNKKVGLIKYVKYVVHPTSDLPLDSFLDEAFLEIVDQHGKGKRKTIAKYVEDVATSYTEGSFIVDVILESLVEKKILKENESSTFLGTNTLKYSLGEKEEVFKNLSKKLRQILMDDKVETTPFMTYLLRFMRQADKEFFMRNPFMNHVLKNKMERNKAKTKWGGNLNTFDKLSSE